MHLMQFQVTDWIETKKHFHQQQAKLMLRSTFLISSAAVEFDIVFKMCSICREEIAFSADLASFGCGHIFHLDCIVAFHNAGEAE